MFTMRRWIDEDDDNDDDVDCSDGGGGVANEYSLKPLKVYPSGQMIQVKVQSPNFVKPKVVLLTEEHSFFSDLLDFHQSSLGN